MAYMNCDIPEEALPWGLAFANNMIFKESSVVLPKKEYSIQRSPSVTVPVVWWQAAMNFIYVVLPLEGNLPYDALI